MVGDAALALTVDAAAAADDDDVVVDAAAADGAARDDDFAFGVDVLLLRPNVRVNVVDVRRVRGEVTAAAAVVVLMVEYGI